VFFSAAVQAGTCEHDEAAGQSCPAAPACARLCSVPVRPHVAFACSTEAAVARACVTTPPVPAPPPPEARGLAAAPRRPAPSAAAGHARILRAFARNEKERICGTSVVRFVYFSFCSTGLFPGLGSYVCSLYSLFSILMKDRPPAISFKKKIAGALTPHAGIGTHAMARRLCLQMFQSLC
jgi:hypothetical protein